MQADLDQRGPASAELLQMWPEASGFEPMTVEASGPSLVPISKLGLEPVGPRSVLTGFGPVKVAPEFANVWQTWADANAPASRSRHSAAGGPRVEPRCGRVLFRGFRP